MRILQARNDSSSARLFSWYTNPLRTPEVSWNHRSCSGSVEVVQRKDAPKKKSACTASGVETSELFPKCPPNRFEVLAAGRFLAAKMEFLGSRYIVSTNVPQWQHATLICGHSSRNVGERQYATIQKRNEKKASLVVQCYHRWRRGDRGFLFNILEAEVERITQYSRISTSIVGSEPLTLVHFWVPTPTFACRQRQPCFCAQQSCGAKSRQAVARPSLPAMPFSLGLPQMWHYSGMTHFEVFVVPWQGRQDDQVVDPMEHAEALPKSQLSVKLHAGVLFS